jgi:NADPH-dependent 2,4-dienoyl-CoA reductase/sulfur reductase-like enzyme
MGATARIPGWFHQLETKGVPGMTPFRIVIIGGVAAGMSAASQAKRRRPDAEVVVFERGTRISYGACGMPYNIEDPDRDMEDLVVLSPEAARSDRGIGLHLQHEVVAVDATEHLVTVQDLADGSRRTEPWDALIIATGARAISLPLPGFDLPGVLPLRDLDHGHAVKHRVAQDRVRRAVVVGAGYIGMEMAHVLTARGLEVTVLERLPRILPGWHEDTVARAEEMLDKQGVTVHAGTTVHSAEPGPDGHVCRVLSDAGAHEAELVLVAAGVRPNVEIATTAGVALGDSGAIRVDTAQRTSVDGIFAAGDCAEAFHRVLRHNAWIPLGTTANKQGRVAGANACGADERFKGIVGTAGFLLFDLELARTGLDEEAARAAGHDPVSVTIRQGSRAHGIPGGQPTQVHLVADRISGRLLGCEIAGRDGAALRINTVAAALAAQASVEELQNTDMVYAPPFAPVWDPILVASNQLIKKVGTES